MDSEKRVGIVIPTLAERITLNRSIQSVIDCGCEPYLLVPKNRLENLDSWARDSTTIIVDYGSGLTKELDRALHEIAVKHEVIGWLGDDDFMSPNGIKTILDSKANGETIGITYGWVRYLDKGGKNLGVNRFGRLAKTPAKYFLNFFSQPGSLISSKAYIAVGGLDHRYSYAFDLDLFIRISKGFETHLVPELVASYTWHDDTLTAKNRLTSALESARARRELYNLFTVIFWPFAEVTSLLVLFLARRVWAIKAWLQYRK